MRVHIRGNAGTQILQAAAALSVLPVDAEPIICVNHGGNLSYDGTNKLNHFFRPQIRIIDVDTMNKTPYWEAGVATSIFENRDKIFRWLPMLEVVRMAADVAHMYSSNRQQALHIRGGDKPIMSEASYSRLVSLSTNATVFTDDREFARRIAPTNAISNGGWFDDWIDMMMTNCIFAAPSSFVMSMLLFNPEKKILFTGDTYNDGGYDVSKDMIFLREAMPYCRNVEII